MDDFCRNRLILVLVFAAKFPLETVNDTFDAGLKDICSHAHSAPSVGAIGKNSQHSNQRAGAFVFVIPDDATMVQQSNVELLQADLRKLRVMFLQDFSHGVVNGLYRTSTAGGHKFLLSENLDQNRGFGGTAQRLWSLEVNLVIDLTTEHAKGL